MSGEVIEIRSGKVETPKDEITGQAYGIRITLDDLDKPGAFHHHEHPKFCDELGLPRSMDDLPVDEIDIGVLQRVAVVTWAPDVHHMEGEPNGYHRALRGPRIDTNDTSKFKVGGLGLVGVRPRTAIDMSRYASDRAVVLRPLKPREFVLMTDPRLTHIEGNTPGYRARAERWAGHAIINYALNREELPELIGHKRRKFVDAYGRNPARQDQTARQIIKKAVARAIEKDLRPAYSTAVGEGMAPLSGWPSPEEAIMSILPEHEFNLHHEQLQRILKGIAKPALQTEVRRVQLAAA